MVSWWKGKLSLTGEHEISYHKFAISHEETGFQLIHLIFLSTSFEMEFNPHTNIEMQITFLKPLP